jgi:Carboxypeptidase regulatory-like domain
MDRKTTSGKNLIVPLLSIFFLVGSVSIAAYSQNSQGTILGHVQDSSGAAVAGANVTASNVNTNVIHQFTIKNSGDYLFVNMIPGTYRVKVERDGFKMEVSGDLILEVDQTLRQDFTLQVGALSETITVFADVQMLQTDNTTTGNVLDQKAIEELPSSGRDFNNLVGLVAGAGTLSGGAQNNGWVNHGLNKPSPKPA